MDFHVVLRIKSTLNMLNAHLIGRKKIVGKSKVAAKLAAASYNYS